MAKKKVKPHVPQFFTFGTVQSAKPIKPFTYPKGKRPKALAEPVEPPRPGYTYGVLMSGGPDSCSALVAAHGLDKKAAASYGLAIMFDYGQAAFNEELDAAKRFVKSLTDHVGGRVDIFVVEVPLLYSGYMDHFGFAPAAILYAKKLPVRKLHFRSDLPFRNHLLALHAAGICNMLGVPKLMIGCGYSDETAIAPLAWDATPEAVHSINSVLKLSSTITGTKTKRGAKVVDHHAIKESCVVVSPMLGKKRFKWLRGIERQLQGISPDLTLADSWSCGAPALLVKSKQSKPCHHCGSCRKRNNVFPGFYDLDRRRRVTLPKGAIQL